MSGGLKEVFLPIEYESKEAKAQEIRANSESLEIFVKGLKQRKAEVYAAIMKGHITGFDGVVTLSSLLLQMNLFCRKQGSLQLLKQLRADELTEAILSFYDASYVKMAEYARFVKDAFACLQ